MVGYGLQRSPQLRLWAQKVVGSLAKKALRAEKNLNKKTSSSSQAKATPQHWFCQTVVCNFISYTYTKILIFFIKTTHRITHNNVIKIYFVIRTVSQMIIVMHNDIFLQRNCAAISLHTTVVYIKIIINFFTICCSFSTSTLQ